LADFAGIAANPQAQLGESQAERTGMATSLAEAKAEHRHDQARIRELEARCATLEKAGQQKDKEILQLTQQVTQQRDNQES
jgi:predicted nuclease with TOPRIM domain